MAAAGVPDIKQKLLKGHEANGTRFNVHLDGYNFLPYLTSETKEGPREQFFYSSDDGLLLAVRDGPWKIVFSEQRAKKFNVWAEPFVQLRVPKIFNLRQDPFERADTDSNSYEAWWEKKISARGGAAVFQVQRFLSTFADYPQRQKPASFTIDQMMEKFLSPEE
jgi:arylsulfatase